MRRNKSVNDELFQNSNSYYENINFREKSKNVITEITRNNNTVSTQVLTKLTKFPVHWSSKIPTNNKRSPSTSELHRATIITKDFEEKRIVNTKMII